MSDLDLNLLLSLDMLLAECSVTKAAHRLHVSTSAMSRTLSRLRKVTGDPLLVRAGRALVPTPRALEIRDQVHEVTRDAKAILRPQASDLDMASITGTFTIRASQCFMKWLSGPVVTAVSQLAPRMCLRFEARPQKDAQPLREGVVDLDIGLIETLAPEIRTRFLFHDAYVGVVREGHAILKGGKVTAQDFAAFDHVSALQEGAGTELLRNELESFGLERRVRVVVPSYQDAMRIVRQSELIGLVPRSCLGIPHLQGPTLDVSIFELPASLPGFQISAMWHPRMDADPVHRSLRNCIISVCQEAYPVEDV
ncbi:LysR family transcriptional regulator [Pseudomonas putida]|uniref:LysR family transcriptional regulator n=1 Tax=Pseudomonas putida TaxID=303 RepID=UPI0023644973|nr:LysR family transcriptional regulator [Pseudomonas putida]MDD1963860.1 LysR family transcriptional regulator [Pseudomonas putida]